VPASADTVDRTRTGELPGAAVRALVAAGLDVSGVLDIAVYDALVPEGWQSRQLLPVARSAWVIGSGGDGLARRALAVGGPDPVDDATSLAVERCIRLLAEAGLSAVALYAFERRDVGGARSERAGRYADFVALGHEAGLGAPSRLRLLVHPVYGPWMAIRSVVLTSAKWAPSSRLPDFAPCDGCAAPCRDACPAGALSAGDLEMGVCLAERLRGDACALHCAARRACVFGREHAYSEEVEAHFMRNSLRMAAR
jgi:hypothetical protein